jgi:hypothetical protein
MMRAAAIAIALGACGSEADVVPGPDASAAVVCGQGTIEQDGACIAGGRYFEIRISETELGANGRTRRRIVAFGTEDGAPINEPVVVGVVPASAGRVDTTAQTRDT